LVLKNILTAPNQRLFQYITAEKLAEKNEKNAGADEKNSCGPFYY
jgi:hypothetical protein